MTPRPVQLEMSRGVKATYSRGSQPWRRGLRLRPHPGHFPPRQPFSYAPGLPPPRPLIPAKMETAPGWLGPKPSPGNWVSGMLMVMLMVRL